MDPTPPDVVPPSDGWSASAREFALDLGEPLLRSLQLVDIGAVARLLHHDLQLFLGFGQSIPIQDTASFWTRQ